MPRPYWCLFAFALALGADWKAGVAKVAITPRKPLCMVGFGARTKLSEGSVHDLYAKALALEDRSGRPAVLVTTDLVGFNAALARNIAYQAEKQYRLSRDRLMLNSSHTHSGPALTNPIVFWGSSCTNPEQWRDVEEYTREVEGKVVAVIGAALKDLRPARLSFGRTQVGFAVNRRRMTEKGIVSFVPNPDGPVDLDVPLLRVDSERGRLRGVVFGYACHASAVLAQVYQFNGDYPGFAQQWLEERHPDAVAFFLAGCGGDIMAHPRGTVEHARNYGETLAAAVDKAMGESLASLRNPLIPAFEVFPVAFARPPSRAELERRLQDKDPAVRRHAQELLKMLDQHGRLPADYPFPLQVWQFGQDLTLIALAGEPVVDYALRLKRELGAERSWVAGYSNDVFAYIPSLRVLQEGGYEGGGATIGARLPGPFAPSVEETIVGKVHELVARVRSKK
ncbi:MAG: neutral/alkaline non-lysosomal ceramidase N-terminal domain-containing protein [Acidobacteriota bacterium]